MKNNIKEIQDLIMKQMKRLDTGCTKDEIQLETQRSGALSQNAQAYLKSLSIGIKVKEMSKSNKREELNILREIGAINEE